MRSNETTNERRTAVMAVWRPALIVALLTHALPVHAYLDPGTGSILLQSLLAGIAVAMGVLRLYWQRCKDFFASLTGASRRQSPQADAGETRDSSQNPD